TPPSPLQKGRGSLRGKHIDNSLFSKDVLLNSIRNTRRQQRMRRLIFYALLAASLGGVQGVWADPMAMTGFYGPYPMSREASGTAWQPESSPQEGLQLMAGGWMGMIHGFVNGIYDDQSGPRGSRRFFSNSMLMTMLQHPLGPGTFGIRNMLSLDPLMGSDGYPEL